MKKSNPLTNEHSDLPAGKSSDRPDRPRPAEQMISVPLRSHPYPPPAGNFFTVVPDVDLEALLCHASETLASLSVMATDLARELEGPRRHVMVGIQQMSALGELLVNRALDNLDPPTGASEASTNSPR